MKKPLITLFLVSAFYSCSQQANKDSSSNYLESESKSSIKVFFEKMQSGDYKIALNELLRKNENIDLQDSLTINLKNKFNAINESSGKYVSESFLRKRELPNDLGIYVYFVKYQTKFYRFTFTFYNNGSQVKIYKFSFDDTIDRELEEAIKLYVN